MHRRSNIQCRRVAHIVAVRLEGGSQHRDVHAKEVATDETRRHGDCLLPPSHVDLVDFAEEADGIGRAQLTRPRSKGANVLRQTATAESETGIEEATPDPIVVAERAAQCHHVSVGDLADLRHRVDERDLRREERVCRDLHHFRRGQICREVRHTVFDDARVHVHEELLPILGDNPEDQPIGVKCVFDRGAFPEKLRVPGHFELVSVGARCHGCLQTLRGPDGHRRLTDDQAVAIRMIEYQCNRRVHVLEIRRIGAGKLRGSHTDEMHHSVADGVFGSVGEPKTSCRENLGQQLVQRGLVERRLSVRQRLYAGGVRVEGNDVVSDLGHARSVYCPQIAGPDHTDLQENSPHALEILAHSRQGGATTLLAGNGSIRALPPPVRTPRATEFMAVDWRTPQAWHSGYRAATALRSKFSSCTARPAELKDVRVGATI